MASIMFSLGFWGGLLAAVFYIVFGQVTVRRLRKKPETRENLGIEFVSGMNIMGVAQMLSLPRSWARALDKRPNSFLMANSEALYENTTLADRIIARIFYYLSTFSVLILIGLAIAKELGKLAAS